MVWPLLGDFGPSIEKEDKVALEGEEVDGDKAEEDDSMGLCAVSCGVNSNTDKCCDAEEEDELEADEVTPSNAEYRERSCARPLPQHRFHFLTSHWHLISP